MATIGAMLGDATINAFVLYGSNFLFPMFRSEDIDKERKRHDTAIDLDLISTGTPFILHEHMCLCNSRQNFTDQICKALLFCL